MRKKASVLLLVCLMGLAMTGPVAAQEGSSEIPYSNVLYLHPLSLIVSTAIPDNPIFPMVFCLTYERALKPQVALIVTPLFTIGNFETDWEKYTSTSFGAGLGIRRYLGKPVSGIYLQAKLNMEYGSAKLEMKDELTSIIDDLESSGVIVDALGYLGVKGHWGKVCMFLDAGVGYQYIGIEFNKDTDLSLSKTGLGLDFNFGLGYGF